MLAVLVFLAAATLAFCIMAVVRIRGSVKRRAATIASTSDGLAQSHSIRHSSFKLAQRLMERATKHYASSNEGDAKVLRGRLIKAGIFDPRAVGYFFVIRVTLAIGLGGGVLLFAPTFQNPATQWFLVVVG